MASQSRHQIALRGPDVHIPAGGETPAPQPSGADLACPRKIKDKRIDAGIGVTANRIPVRYRVASWHPEPPWVPLGVPIL